MRTKIEAVANVHSGNWWALAAPATRRQRAQQWRGRRDSDRDSSWESWS